MKKTLLNTLTFVSLCIASAANAQVGIGVPAGDIHPSAELEVKSTEKGFLLPRMTKAQRIAIGSPATGLIVYQTDGDVPNPAGLYYFDGLLWKNGIGAQGIQGTAGATGPQGPVGAVGPKGDTGPIGPQGIQGLKGDTGSQGPVGPAGANGTNGTQGLPGAVGPQGVQGPIGPAGTNGTNGAQGLPGAKGDTGAQGPIGPAGANGTNGAQGITGAQGIQGKTGDTGPQGPVGPAGANGTNGAQGSPGAKGDTGAQGLPGAQGIQGKTGDTGAQGPQGPAGVNGTNGTPGAKGDTGAQGIQGKTGDTGPQGPVGPAGANGTNGAEGSPGAKGDTGAQGIQGLKGDKGDVGATGPQGVQGPAGATGDQGPQGIQGEVGPAGPKGDPGTSTGATQLTINSTVANTNNRLSFTNAISGSAVSSLQTSPSLTFNPSTGNLSALTFTGNVTGNLTGNASSASQVAVTNSFSTGTNYLSFSPSASGVSDLKTNSLLTFNPGTGNLSAPDFTGRLTGDVTGNATSASKVAVTSTTVFADRYLCFTPNTSSGNADLQINSLSQGLKYNPGTGVLTVPSIKTPTGTSSQYLMADGSVSSANPQGAVGPAGPKGDTGEKGEPGKDGVAGTSGQSVLFNPTTPPTNGMLVYKYFQNNKTTTLYDDGQIRLRLSMGSGKLYLTNVNKNIPTILSNIGTLNSSGGASMSMTVFPSYIQNFGTAAVTMGTEMNVYSNLSTPNNYVMTMYISAPDNPSYGLYVINIYFNGPSSLNYSNMTVNYYKDPTATP